MAHYRGRFDFYKVGKFTDKERLALEKKIGHSVVVEKINDKPSRAERMSAALDKISEAKSEIEELKDELQSWLDGLPENLQSSGKADELSEAISSLEQLESELDSASGTQVDFPGMY